MIARKQSGQRLVFGAAGCVLHAWFELAARWRKIATVETGRAGMESVLRCTRTLRSNLLVWLQNMFLVGDAASRCFERLW